MDRSLIYVSRRALATLDPQTTVNEIVATARSRNALLRVTGGLVCNNDYFAQLLEGPSGAIDELMHSIEADVRHTDITILDERSTMQRSLPNWEMAYNGESSYVALHLTALLEGSESLASSRVERLRSLIVGLAKSSPAQDC